MECSCDFEMWEFKMLIGINTVKFIFTVRPVKKAPSYPRVDAWAKNGQYLTHSSQGGSARLRMLRATERNTKLNSSTGAPKSVSLLG